MDSDASYGYLKLQDYKCYYGWTGEGDALNTDEVVIYRTVTETGATFDDCSDSSGWDNVSAGSDGDTATIAAKTYFASEWTTYPFIAMNNYPSGRRCTSVKWYITDKNMSTLLPENKIIDILIQVTYDGTNWTTIEGSWDSSWFDDWGQHDFGDTVLLKGVRIYIRSSAADGTSLVCVNEVEMVTTDENETSLFVQGENEATFRCAIGDYHSVGTYHVGYFHAAYIKNTEAITSVKERSKIITSNYITDGATLFKWARAQLPLTAIAEKTYSSNIIFLDEVDKNFEFDELRLGNLVTLIQEELDINDKLRIVGKSQPDLDNPANGSIEIQTKIRSLADSFRALWARI